MTQTVSFDTKIAKDILATLQDLKREIVRLNQVLADIPAYGSDEWWKWSNAKALNSIKAGKGIVIHNKKELDKFFNSL